SSLELCTVFLVKLFESRCTDSLLRPLPAIIENILIVIKTFFNRVPYCSIRFEARLLLYCCSPNIIEVVKPIWRSCNDNFRTTTRGDNRLNSKPCINEVRNKRTLIDVNHCKGVTTDGIRR